MEQQVNFTVRLMSLLVSLCLSFGAIAQSSEYTIESFQGTYTELSTYESIAILTGGDRLWEYDFNLEFPFPFYDSVYTWLHYDEESWGSFTLDEDVALLLMNFNTYTYDEVTDTANISSDVRFSHVEVNNLDAFVIQYTNAQFFADPNGDSHDTKMNFQIWLFENGNIEVHFGEMNMDNNPIYAPGIGFYDYTTSGGVDTTYVAGPFMGISHPLNEENAIALDGSYDNYEVVGDQYSILTTLPPIGWVIRFKPTFVSTSEPTHYESISISPNPANDFITLPFKTEKIGVYNGSGRLIFNGSLENNIFYVNELPQGLYLIKIVTEEKIYTGRFVKQ